MKKQEAAELSGIGPEVQGLLDVTQTLIDTLGLASESDEPFARQIYDGLHLTRRMDSSGVRYTYHESSTSARQGPLTVVRHVSPQHGYEEIRYRYIEGREELVESGLDRDKSVTLFTAALQAYIEQLQQARDDHQHVLLGAFASTR